MTRLTFRDALFPNCPIRNILARIGDKWTLLVIYTLQQTSGPMRFNALHKAIPDISQKMLTHTLRCLEEDGMIQRTVYPEIPPRVEYTLTERAGSLLPLIDALIEWASTHMEAILQDRNRISASH